MRADIVFATIIAIHERFLRLCARSTVRVGSLFAMNATTAAILSRLLDIKDTRSLNKLGDEPRQVNRLACRHDETTSPGTVDPGAPSAKARSRRLRASPSTS